MSLCLDSLRGGPQTSLGEFSGALLSRCQGARCPIDREPKAVSVMTQERTVHDSAAARQ